MLSRKYIWVSILIIFLLIEIFLIFGVSRFKGSSSDRFLVYSWELGLIPTAFASDIVGGLYSLKKLRVTNRTHLILVWLLMTGFIFGLYLLQAEFNISPLVLIFSLFPIVIFSLLTDLRFR